MIFDTFVFQFCQKSSDGELEFALGDQQSSAFKFNENDDFLVIQYKSSYRYANHCKETFKKNYIIALLNRTSNLLCICAENEFFSFVNEEPALNYVSVLLSFVIGLQKITRVENNLDVHPLLAMLLCRWLCWFDGTKKAGSL